MTTIHDRLAQRLLDEAATSDPSVAKPLVRAAKKLAGYSYQPATRKEADRVGSVLDPAIVAPLGQHLLDAYADDSLFWSPGRAYAVALLLIATQDDATAPPAERALTRLGEGLERLPVSEVEGVHALAGLYDDLAPGRSLHAEAERILRREPPTLGEDWAARVGVEVPFERWDLRITLRGTMSQADDGAQAPRDSDIELWCDIGVLPAVRTRWSVGFGLVRRDELGRDGREPGTPMPYDRGCGVAGAIPAPATPADLGRVVTDLQERHPGLVFAPARLSGRPRSVAAKDSTAAVRAWLAG